MEVGYPLMVNILQLIIKSEKVLAVPLFKLLRLSGSTVHILSGEEPAGKGPLQIEPAAWPVTVQDLAGKEKSADALACQCLGTYFSQVDTPFRNHGLTEALGPRDRQGQILNQHDQLAALPAR